MKDLTPILMGDPGTSPRRAPTQEEIEKMRSRTVYEQKRAFSSKYSKIYEWKLWETRTFATKREAKSKQDGLYQNGMQGMLRKAEDGTYIVRRVQ